MGDSRTGRFLSSCTRLKAGVSASTTGSAVGARGDAGADADGGHGIGSTSVGGGFGGDVLPAATIFLNTLRCSAARHGQRRRQACRLFKGNAKGFVRRSGFAKIASSAT